LRQLRIARNEPTPTISAVVVGGAEGGRVPQRLTPLFVGRVGDTLRVVFEDASVYPAADLEAGFEERGRGEHGRVGDRCVVGWKFGRRAADSSGGTRN
jgi:hypothetical protein